MLEKMFRKIAEKSNNMASKCAVAEQERKQKHIADLENSIKVLSAEVKTLKGEI